MRTRTRTVQVPGTHTINGQTMPVIREQQIVEPVPPRDWDVLATRAAVTVIVVLTTFSVVWSTVSIARLLGGGWAATLAAATFDAAWIVTGVIAYLVRHQPDRRAVVDRGGWALVAVTVIALGVEGWRTSGLAAACAGAAVSLIAKGLWWMFDRATRAPLSSDDRQWLAGRRSQLGAQRALLAMQRQVAREQAQVAELAGSTPPDPDRPRGSTQVDLDPPQVDPTPALESTPTQPSPAPTAQVTAPQVDPRSTRQVDPTPAPGRPELHAVPDQVDPADLDRARAVVAALRRDQIAPSTEQIRRRMGIGRDRARACWLAIQADEADPARRTA
ncbi:hypothetical protein MXD62_19855 [Frankia sp. Mgl5]|uniref:hypothetical protein n=1 Tax=Frankia sp. Mgl5 TaxID=2933793 RepID=UPI00200FCC40|nr:hypothetical protein [Frankia sp. Mgl5]MCK9929406.1 hypothetical protein [Frankia sp. Mgl5]